MPSKCSVIGCRSNYRMSEEYFTVYALPKTEPNRTKWLDAIPTDFSGLKNPMVCIKHFAESDIIRREYFHLKGELVSFRRRIPKLKVNAIPSIFPNFGEYLLNELYNKKRLQHRKRYKKLKCLSDTINIDDLTSLDSLQREIGNDNTGQSNDVNEEIIIIKDEDNVDLMMECSEDIVSEIKAKELWEVDQTFDDNCHNEKILNADSSDCSIENNYLTSNSVLFLNYTAAQSTIPTSVSSFDKKSQGKEINNYQIPSVLSKANSLYNSVNHSIKNNICSGSTSEPPVLFLPESIVVDNPNASIQLVQTPEQFARLLSNTETKSEKKLFIPERLFESEEFKKIIEMNAKMQLECLDKSAAESNEMKCLEYEIEETLQKRINKNTSSPEKDKHMEKQLEIENFSSENCINNTNLKNFSAEGIGLEKYYYAFKDSNEKALDNIVKEDTLIRCYVCKIIVLNNINMMEHLNTHISDQSLSDFPLFEPVKCSHCLNKFDNPFKLHCHLHSIHWNAKTLLCRICNLEFKEFEELTFHMKILHFQCEMPYSCKLCQYRSSVYKDVIAHFEKTHVRTKWMMCYYCLKLFRIKSTNKGIGFIKDYFYHMQRHQLKSAMRKCSNCCLIFLNVQERKEHQLTDHILMIDEKGIHPFESPFNKNQDKNPITIINEDLHKTKDSSHPVKKIDEELYRSVDGSHSLISNCHECGSPITSKHFTKRLSKCACCCYSTSCQKSLINHVLNKHSENERNTERKFKPIESDFLMTCKCGYSSAYGNLTAKHLMECKKMTCKVVHYFKRQISTPKQLKKKTVKGRMFSHFSKE